MNGELINDDLLKAITSYKDDRSSAHRMHELLGNLSKDNVTKYIEIINNYKAG